MAAVNRNHANYERRLNFIRHEIPFPTRFNIEKADITPIAYDAECPFDYNNFIYRLTLSSATSSEDNTKEPAMQQQTGCKATPDGVTEFIVRLTNPNADGMNTENRVENEVAMISLFEAALSHYSPKVVPSVYGWGSAAAESSQGWILQELMPGASLDVALDSMDLQNKKAIFAQMAGMLSAMQKYCLPPSITGSGGLTFDSVGRIVSSRMTSVGAGPWPSYEEQYKGRLRVALARADANPYIRGWQANGVRKRIDVFVDHGVHTQFRNLDSKEEKVLTHADFTGNNMLYDPAANRITALLDYDFSCISHPSYEFFCSFGDTGGRFQGWSGDEDTEQLALHDAKLHGFPSPLPPSLKEKVNWALSDAWENELGKVHVLRPRTVQGIEHVADIEAILGAIGPWPLANVKILEMQSEEAKVKLRRNGEKKLIKILDRFGF